MRPRPRCTRTTGARDKLVAAYVERRTEAARLDIEAYVAAFPPEQRALRFFDYLVEWTARTDFSRLSGPAPGGRDYRSHPSGARDGRRTAPVANGCHAVHEWARAAGATEFRSAPQARCWCCLTARWPPPSRTDLTARDARWTAERVLDPLAPGGRPVSAPCDDPASGGAII